uniref:Cysteine-rich protein 2 n=1 Tax=Sus scrofa TaxID=9823 RepID=A0A8D1Z818_PIG
MASKCPKCDKTVYFAEKVSSLGKDWHRFCLRCEHCSKTLTPGGHAEHDGKPFCHKPCYATLFGPKGVNIGGAGSYIYEKPSAERPQVTGPIEVPVARAEERKAGGPPKGPSKASSVTTFTGEPNMCPRCNKRVYFAEKVTSLGKDWHRPCLRCERCGKTLTPGGHAEVRPGRGRPAGRGRAARGGARCPLAARPGPAWARRLGGRRCRRCRPPQLPPRWAAGLAEALAAGGSGGRAPGPGGSRRGSEAHGPRPHRPCPVPSTTASPTATSPATEYSSDPRVSVARRVGMCPSPSPLPTTLASLSAGVNTGAVGSYIYDKDPEGKVQP